MSGRVGQDIVESSAPSCFAMKNDWSMDQPLTFKREGLIPELRVKQERVESPAPSCLSVKSDWSMDRPPLFKRECLTPELSELSSSLLSKDHFRCSVCSEGLREPVSIACGHSYCRQCISTYWARPSHAGDYQCPQCSKSFPTRPELSTNTALVSVLQALQQAGFSPVLPAVAQAGPGDVACDICCGPKLRAVKTCVTCSASYCESHVRQHYTVPALQRHTLIQVTGDQRHTHQQDSVKKMEIIEEEQDKTHSKLKEEEEFESRHILDRYFEKKTRLLKTDYEGKSDPLKRLQKNSGLKTFYNRLLQKNSGLRTLKKGLQQDNSVLKSFNTGLLQKNSGLKTLNTGLQQDNSVLKTLNTDLQLENLELKTFNWGLLQKNSGLKTLNTDLQLENFVLKTFNWGLRQKNSGLKTLNTDLQHKYSELKTFNRVLQQDNSVLKTFSTGLLQEDSGLKTVSKRWHEQSVNIACSNIARLEPMNFELQKSLPIVVPYPFPVWLSR